MVGYTIRYLRLDEMWYLPKQRLMVFLTVKSLSDSLLPGVWSPTNLSHKYRAHSHLPTLSPNSTDTRSILHNNWLAYSAVNLTVKCTAIKCLEEYIGEYRIRNTERFHRTRYKKYWPSRKRLINLTTVDELLLIKKIGKSRLRKVFRTHIIDKGLIFRIYKELLMGV